MVESCILNAPPIWGNQAFLDGTVNTNISISTANRVWITDQIEQALNKDYVLLRKITCLKLK